MEFGRLHNLHPWYWNSLLYGLISSGEREFSAFSAPNAIHNSQFSFHQVPITAGWAKAVWDEKFARHLYT